jgi:pyruvate formate lyase activating enzyme
MDNFPGIFDLYRGSFVDGPGIRTVIFFSGCTLRCIWCHNPESWSEDLMTVVRFSPQELVETICRDQFFFNSSGGGVTFSGGEPLLYPKYLREVCQLLKTRSIHCAVETSGCFDEEVFSLGLDRLIDLFLFDLKIIDPSAHRKYTGLPNDRILKNFGKLAITGKTLKVTIPLIPGFTATQENLSAIAALLKANEITEYELMTYNPTCIDKRKKAGLADEPLLRSQPLSVKEEMTFRIFFDELMKRPDGMQRKDQTTSTLRN